MNLLGGHRLRLDDAARFFLADNSQNNVSRLRAGAGPMDLGPSGFQFSNEFSQILVEVIYRFPLDLGRGLARRRPILIRGLRPVAHRLVFAQRGLDELTMAQIVSLLLRTRFEFGGERFHDGSSSWI